MSDIESSTPEVHYSDWSQQPDVHFACGVWTTPAWTQTHVDLPKLVYEDDEGRLYTFQRHELVTCQACLDSRSQLRTHAV